MTGTTILLTTLGGISLLLWGCRMVRTGVIRAYGGDLQKLVTFWAGHRLKALGSGVAIGAALQSSTATVLLLTSFVGQEAISVATALVIVLGADFGAAVAASIFSSGVAIIWPLIAFTGYLAHVNFDGRSVLMKNVGRILIGLGLVFLGLQTIGESASSLSQSAIVTDTVRALSHETFLAILIGAILTWLAYSSLAVVLLVIALTTGGNFSAEMLYPVLLGVNVGAALPAVSATLSESPKVRRVALGNLIFRAIGVLIMLPLLPSVAEYLSSWSSLASVRIIIFHLGFNAGLCLVFLWLTPTAAKLTRHVLPDQRDDSAGFRPKFLDEKLLATPSGALGAAARETLHMGEIVENMLQNSMDVLDTGDKAIQAEICASDDHVDDLNEAIKLYLTKLMRGELSEREGERAVDIITFTTNLEHVGDIIDNNLMDLADKKRRNQVQFSKEGAEELRSMHRRIVDTLHLSLNTFISQEADVARELINRKSELRSLGLEGTESHIERLTEGHPESMATSSIHLDVMRDFKRINSHLTSVAYPVLDRAGQLRTSRLKKAKNFKRAELPSHET